MIQIAYNKTDLRYIFLRSDTNGEMQALEKHLNKIPQYMFLPSFKGVPKPEVFLHKANHNGQVVYYAHAGLWREVYNFCNDNNIDVTGIDDYFKYRNFSISLGEFEQLVRSWQLTPNPREYQIKAAWLILKYHISLSQLATRAGKTLIAYIVFRYMLENGAHNVLMIVPNIQLVKQGVDDMAEYKEFFKSETVWSKGEMCESANLTIGTFQSLVNRLNKKSKRYNPKFFDKFDVVCIDEAHTAKCKSINAILNQPFLKDVKLKFGFSGSLPVANTIDSFACQSLIGPTIQDVRARELMDDGYIAEAEVHQIRINYTEEETLDDYIKCGEYLCSNDAVKITDGKRVVQKLPKNERSFTIVNQKTLPFVLQQIKPGLEKWEYRDYLIDLCKANGANLLMLEQMLVHRSEKRLKVMDSLIDKMDGNVIVFAHHTEYLNFLEKYFAEHHKCKKVMKIVGSTVVKKREEIIKEMQERNDIILCASYKCVGTGLTLKNLKYGIFAQSFKSQIINKQSLGRGLCLAGDKDKYILYDIIDCFPSGKLLQQGKQKVTLFKNEDIPISVTNVQ